MIDNREHDQSKAAVSGSSHSDWIEAARQEFEEVRNRSSAPHSFGADAGISEALSQCLPGYEISGEIHRGGQGMVFKSIQPTTRRNVAIKVMREGPFAGPQDRARFEREVQILGQLKHPNIVTILDSGSSAGHFYFIMDYIQGLPLDDYVVKHNLSVHQTLELFAKICDAVHVAHLRGVIHRDLKPSNIRVDPSGEPHVMDFGLAKVDEFDVIADSDHFMRTTTGQFIGSLPWSSPEQLEGKPDKVDIRTDVYSMGVMLYQILARRFPYDVTGHLRDVLDNICNIDPPKPGTIDPRIDDEVDQIVLKCLRKDREQRYESGGDLAREIRRYLSGEPIEAKGDSVVYVLGKHLRRHKFPVAAGVGFVGLVTAGFIVSLSFWHDAANARDAEADQRRIAEENEKIAKAETAKAKAVNAFLKEMLGSASPKTTMGRDVSVREVLDEAARRIEGGEFSGQPTLEASVRRTIGVTYRELGLYKEAEPYLKKALDLCTEYAGPDAPDTLLSMYEFAVLLQFEGRTDEAEPLYQRALEAQRRILTEEHVDTMTTMMQMASLLQDQAKYDEAEQMYRKTLDLAAHISGEEHTLTLLVTNNLANLLRTIGRLHQAEELFRKLVDIRTRKMGELHPETIVCTNNLANTLRDQGKLAEAEPMFRQVLEDASRVWGDRHPHTLLSASNLGMLLGHLGNLPEAESMLRRAYEGSLQELGEEHNNTLVSMNNLAQLLQARGKTDEATSLLQLAVKTRRRVHGEEHPDTLITANNLVQLLELGGKVDEAEALLKEILSTCQDSLGEEHVQTLMARFHLANLYRDLRQFAKAERIYQQVVESAERVLPPDDWHTPGMRTTWGACLANLERYADAEKQLLAGYEGLQATLGDVHPITKHAVGELIGVYQAMENHDEVKRWTNILEADNAGGS
ncbi:MAG: serine/threonine-protein kinase [Phycisphaerales bacterium]|nr:serine/threonine-protein kinase [Phycisphaerales bacterium]